MIRIVIIIALTVLILLTASTTFLRQTYAFGPTCQYSNVAYNYPNEVSPSEQFIVSISLPAVCPQASNYHITARFDVENSMNRVLASNFTQDGFVPNNGKPFTFTVTNDLTAPSKRGSWQLQFIVYAFMSEDDALGLDYKVQASEIIQVGQPIQLQTSNSTVTSTTTQSLTLSTTTFPTTTQPTAEIVGPTSSSNEMYQVIAAVIAVLLIFTLAILIRRKTHSEAQ
jgi:hypothetical protein